MLNNKKGILILVISLVAIYLLIALISVIPTGKKYNNIVFLGSSTKVTVEDGKISVYNEDKKISKQKVKIYFNHSFVDGYIASEQGESSGTENVYYCYNSNGDTLISDSMLIASTLDKKLDVKEGKTQELKGIKYIQDLLSFTNIASDDDKEIELDYGKIAYIDIDDDGIEDNIYSVGLISESIVDGDQDYISYVYLKKGNSNDYILILKSEASYDGISNQRLSFEKMIDFNGDGNYEFVVEKMMGEYGPFYYELYNFDGSKFTMIGGE